MYLRLRVSAHQKIPQRKKTSYKMEEDICSIYPGDIRNHKLIKMMTQQKAGKS